MPSWTYCALNGFALFAVVKAFNTCHRIGYLELMVEKATTIGALVYSSIYQVTTFVLGLCVWASSLIPWPRSWCPPYVAVFDGLIGIGFGIILYVGILWLIFGKNPEIEDTEEDNTLFQEQPVTLLSTWTDKERKCPQATKQDIPTPTPQTEATEPGDVDVFPTTRTKIDLPRSDDYIPSFKQMRHREPMQPHNEMDDMWANLDIYHGDSVDIPPTSGPMPNQELDMFFQHLVEIEPEESEDSDSDSPCEFCGREYCDDAEKEGDECVCYGNPKRNRNQNANPLTVCESISQDLKVPKDRICTTDLMDWVIKANPDYDNEDREQQSERSIERSTNNSMSGTSSSATLRESIKTASSSDYQTADGSSGDAELGRDSTLVKSAVLGQGDYRGRSRLRNCLRARRRDERRAATETPLKRAKPWRSSGDINSISSVSEDNGLMSVDWRWDAQDYLDLESRSSFSQESRSVDTTLMSSWRPSTPSGVAMVSPVPMTPIGRKRRRGGECLPLWSTNSLASESESVAPEYQLNVVRKAAILDGGDGDCHVTQLNNRSWFLESYQQHLFKTTAEISGPRLVGKGFPQRHSYGQIAMDVDGVNKINVCNLLNVKYK